MCASHAFRAIASPKCRKVCRGLKRKALFSSLLCSRNFWRPFYCKKIGSSMTATRFFADGCLFAVRQCFRVWSIFCLPHPRSRDRSPPTRPDRRPARLCPVVPVSSTCRQGQHRDSSARSNTRHRGDLVASPLASFTNRPRSEGLRGVHPQTRL